MLFGFQELGCLEGGWQRFCSRGSRKCAPCTCREAAEAMALLDAIVEGLVRHFSSAVYRFHFQGEVKQDFSISNHS